MREQCKLFGCSIFRRKNGKIFYHLPINNDNNVPILCMRESFHEATSLSCTLTFIFVNEIFHVLSVSKVLVDI